METSILDAQLLNSSYAWLAADGALAERPRLDAMQYGTGPFQRLYETARGWLCVSVADVAAQWRCLAVLDCDRVSQSDDVVDAMCAAFRTADADTWSARLDAAEVPNEVCSDTFALGLFDDPDMIAKRFVTGYPQPVVGHLEQMGVLSTSPPPLHG